MTAQARLNKTSRSLRSLPEEAVKAATAEVRRATLASLKRSVGSDRKMSGVRNGVPMTVKATQRGRFLVEGHAMAGPRKQRGPWFWLEEGTRPGIRRARGGRSRSGGRHPGTPAKRTWSSAVSSVTPKVRADVNRMFADAIKGR